MYNDESHVQELNKGVDNYREKSIKQDTKSKK
jgi:hypothetical protein